jgi:hypothetical protein
LPSSVVSSWILFDVFSERIQECNYTSRATKVLSLCDDFPAFWRLEVPSSILIDLLPRISKVPDDRGRISRRDSVESFYNNREGILGLIDKNEWESHPKCPAKNILILQ